MIRNRRKTVLHSFHQLKIHSINGFFKKMVQEKTGKRTRRFVTHDKAQDLLKVQLLTGEVFAMKRTDVHEAWKNADKIYNWQEVENLSGVRQAQ